MDTFDISNNQKYFFAWANPFNVFLRNSGNLIV